MVHLRPSLKHLHQTLQRDFGKSAEKHASAEGQMELAEQEGTARVTNGEQMLVRWQDTLCQYRDAKEGDLKSGDCCTVLLRFSRR